MSLLDQLKCIKAPKSDQTVHPILKLGLDRSVIESYFDSIVFAAFANDAEGVVDDGERKKLNDIGGHLGLSSAEVDQTISRIGALGDADKMALVRECLSGWDNSEIVSSFFADFKKVWKIGGGSEEDLRSVYDVFEDWLVPAIREKAKDCEAHQQNAGAVDRLRGACAERRTVVVGAEDVDETEPMSSLIPSIVIRNRKVLVDGVFTVPAGAKLLIENSTLLFNVKGTLRIRTKDAVIRNSSFVFIDKGDNAEFTPDWLVMANDDCNALTFEGCEFRGGGKRGAVVCEGALTLRGCLFENLGNSNKCMIEAKSLKTEDCRFENCRGKERSSLIKGDDVCVERTVIEGCETEFNMFQWSGGHAFEVRESKLKHCLANNNLAGNPAGSSHGFVGPFGFFDCCFVSVKHNGGLTFAYERQIEKQVSMPEEEYDARFGVTFEMKGI